MRRVRHLVTAGICCALASTGMAHDGPHSGPTEAVYRVGKQGQLTLREDVKVGTVLVKKGKYLFTHKVESDRHVLVLTSVGEKNARDATVHEVATQLIPASEQAKKTALFAKELKDHSLDIGIVQIAGETVDHLPRGVITTRQPRPQLTTAR